MKLVVDSRHRDERLECMNAALKAEKSRAEKKLFAAFSRRGQRTVAAPIKTATSPPAAAALARYPAGGESR